MRYVQRATILFQYTYFFLKLNYFNNEERLIDSLFINLKTIIINVATNPHSR